MTVKAPQIPSIHALDTSVKVVLSPIKELLELREGRLGEKTNMNVTWQDLVDLGLITSDQVPR
jgi:hypothetical protein